MPSNLETNFKWDLEEEITDETLIVPKIELLEKT